ncbi:MAG: anti-sigma factor [Marinirhabdus sp.]|nr:anti-sigma factor [Marinirhabdus sp.]
MTEQEIISSGILELYVCGALPESEAIELQKEISGSPTLKKELELVEATYISLAENVAPPLSAIVWTYIKDSIYKATPSDESTTRSINWGAITGWAATIAAVGGILWVLNQNSGLERDIEVTTTENTELREVLNETEAEQNATDAILADIRDASYKAVPLPANPAVAPDAFAKVFYNADESVAYIDAAQLPTAPQGTVYQVWSLKMEPLTPSSMGLLESLKEVKPGLYRFENFPSAEGFGITLEPEGGSESPTLTQLYVLGTVQSAP